MKKFLSVVLFAVTLSLLADEPASSPIVAASTCDIGTYQISVKANVTNVIIPVRFKTLSQVDAETDDLPVSQIMKVSNLTDGDHLIRFNGSSYDGWTYNADDGVWNNDTEINISSATVNVGVSADETSLLMGEALWLVRSEPSSPVNIQLFGKYVATNDMTSTIVRGRWNLIANPTGAKVDGDVMAGFLAQTKNADEDVIGPQIGDKIIVVSSDGLGRTYLYSSTKSGTGWYRGIALENPAVNANCGFWYHAKNGEGNTTFRWAAEE